ncbi:MAG: DUF3108 domain-containing protein [Candidatus Eisenbacteria bacterium]|uniref:DUF3108 domain-containing protein n=1 Tax=Eiseniibacteriota bacterium TaxID=2212470 RepID=A0A948W615_UNCEI|nr:DUF3108 domain-containing protein [Candidatus Eisenbacteria bacterium]MBU1950139.1 DUF3108 domain-containing protein [Candidatus Eisenbacteria bacterium]MBU2690625.1 DUF3108 domain-containing protein [Candidatus Eisenbacteria bacterium]
MILRGPDNSFLSGLFIRGFLLALLIMLMAQPSATSEIDPLESSIDSPETFLPESEIGNIRIRSFEDRYLRQVREETPLRETALVSGEKLVFSVRFGPLRAGEATLEFSEALDQRNRPVYRIQSRAQSNSFVSSFYRVDDHIESLIDRDYLTPVHFEKHLREGKYESDRVVKMDQDNHFAIYEGGEIYEMPPRAHDVLSAFYYVRAMKMAVGDTLRLSSHSDKKNYPIDVIVHRKEKVKVPAGEFNCFVIEPKVSSSALFNSKGKLWIWITDDERRIPVLMKSEIPVGSIDAVLTRLEGRPDRN